MISNSTSLNYATQHYYDEPFNSKPFPKDEKSTTEYFSNCDNLKIRASDDLPDEIKINHQVQQVLTSRSFTYTPKYANKEITITTTAVFIGTGKQVKTGSEQAKRSVEIHLSKKDIGKPRTRDGNEAQLAFVDTNQRQYEILLLSLIRYWILNGSPQASDNIPLKPSFDRWRSVIGGLLEFYNFGNAFLQIDPTRTDGLNGETSIDIELIYQIKNVFGLKTTFTASEVRAKQNDQNSRYLKEVLNELWKEVRTGERGEITKLGNQLSVLANRGDIGGKYMVVKVTERGKNAYAIVEVISNFDQTTTDDRMSEDTPHHSSDCTCRICQPDNYKDNDEDRDLVNPFS